MDVTFYSFGRNEKDPIDWDYLALTDIEFIGEGNQLNARLFCQAEDGYSLVMAMCPRRHFRALEPYAEQYTAWKADPIQHEIPYVPVIRRKSGSLVFCPSGAYLDFPDHPSIQLAASLTKTQQRLVDRIRNEVKAFDGTGFKFIFNLRRK